MVVMATIWFVVLSYLVCMLFCRLWNFSKSTFSKNLSGTPSECQTVWIQIRHDGNGVPDLGPNCLQRLSADDTSPVFLLLFFRCCFLRATF